MWSLNVLLKISRSWKILPICSVPGVELKAKAFDRTDPWWLVNACLERLAISLV